MALWRDAQGAWAAVEDKCPHRLAPLSEGRIEADGSLQCAYHGWQFSGGGACTHIPQLRADERAQAVACASPRACVRAFPCRELHGLLWVMPDSSPEGKQRAASTPVPHTAIKELMGGAPAEGWRQCTQWFARDLPIRYDTLLENVLDPSHVPFAHHGVQGRRENEKGTETSILDEGVAVGGFAFRFDAKSARFPPSRVEFTAPIHTRYGAGFRALHVYVVPTRPGWSRLYATFLQDTRVPVPLPPVINFLFCLVESIPWLEHISQRNKVLDGDTYMIHVTERLLLERGNDWRRGYFMPAAADASVVATRRWLDEFGGAVPTCEPGTPMPPQLTKPQALDRYTQHTAGCRHCKKALKNIETAAAVAAACATLSALWLVARAVAGLPLLAPASGVALLAMAVCGGAVAVLRALQQQFFYVEYVHAHAK